MTATQEESHSLGSADKTAPQLSTPRPGLSVPTVISLMPKRFHSFFFWLHYVACRISVPTPGIEPRPHQWKPGVLTTRPPEISWDSWKEKSNRVSHSIMFDSLPPQGLRPARLLCPWSSPGKNTGVGFTISFSRGSSQPRDQTQVACTVGGFFTVWATREDPEIH